MTPQHRQHSSTDETPAQHQPPEKSDLPDGLSDTETPAQGDGGSSRGGRGIGRSLDTIEDLTGLTAEQIREGFKADPPQTLAEQAVAEGVSQDELVAAVVADTQLRLREAVAAGRITQERANERLAELDINVMELVTTIPTGL